MHYIQRRRDAMDFNILHISALQHIACITAHRKRHSTIAIDCNILHNSALKHIALHCIENDITITPKPIKV